jgi:hypothetical protein
LEQAFQKQETEIYGQSGLPESILKVLAYFDIFNYPLTSSEIHEYCDAQNPEINHFKIELESLVTNNVIKKSGIYYFLDDPSSVSKREKANRHSDWLLKKTEKYSRLISMFPFVRGVCISGSLSKKNADKDADVDYFIITEKNRLWICRTLLVLYKKIFLLNSRRYFCINYFVDTNHLEILDKNIFTATEIAFLLPAYHHDNFFRFMASNSWVSNYYPDKKIEFSSETRQDKDFYLKKAFEFCLNNSAGNLMDDMLLKMTLFYRRIKFKRLNQAEFNRNMRATKGISKHHPNSFQEIVLKSYHDRLRHIEMKYGFAFN